MSDESSTPAQRHDPGTASVMVAQGRTRLVLSGEIDVALSSELTEAVAEAEASRQPVEIDACKGYLRSQIRLIRPRVVVTLGNFATKLLLRTETGITRLRGQAFSWWLDATLTSSASVRR